MGLADRVKIPRDREEFPGTHVASPLELCLAVPSRRFFPCDGRPRWFSTET